VKDFSRTDRLSSQISRELSGIFVNTIIPPSNLIISITEVELSRDLRYSKIYYSVYGDESAIENAEEFFKDNYKSIRKELAARIRVKFMPELKFLYDPSIEREQRISELLDRIKKDEQKS